MEKVSTIVDSGVIIASEKEGEAAAIKHADAASYSVSPIDWVLDVPGEDH